MASDKVHNHFTVPNCRSNLQAELRWKEPEFKVTFNGDYLINVLEANGDETGFKLHKRLGIAIAEATGRKFAIDDLQAGTSNSYLKTFYLLNKNKQDIWCK